MEKKKARITQLVERRGEIRKKEGGRKEARSEQEEADLTQSKISLKRPMRCRDKFTLALAHPPSPTAPPAHKHLTRAVNTGEQAPNMGC
eukprot:731444-Pelagomonas_calceolata.AAC.8